MKKFYSGIFIAVCILISLSASAQAPQGINYQAVARNASGDPLVNTAVTVVFEIRQGGPVGTVVYNASYGLTTNQFGLFSAVIGTVNNGAFSAIAWGSNSY